MHPVAHPGISRLSWRRVSVFALSLASLLAIVWIATTLRDRASASPANPEDPAQVALGQQVYTAQCARCHGANLEGQPDWKKPLPSGAMPAPPHDASGHTWHHADGLLFEIVTKGSQAYAPDAPNTMPAFGDVLSNEEIWAVLAYIKSTWPAETRAIQAGISQNEK